MGVGCSEFGVPCQNQAELSMRGGCEVRPLACVTALASANPLTAFTLFHSVCPFCPLQCTCSPFLPENIFIVYVRFIFKLHIIFLLLNLTPFLTIQFLPYSSISFPSQLHICTLFHTPHPLSALSAPCVCMGRAIYGIMGSFSGAASLEKLTAFLLRLPIADSSLDKGGNFMIPVPHPC